MSGSWDKFPKIKIFKLLIRSLISTHKSNQSSGNNMYAKLLSPAEKKFKAKKLFLSFEGIEKQTNNEEKKQKKSSFLYGYLGFLQYRFSRLCVSIFPDFVINSHFRNKKFCLNNLHIFNCDTS